MFLAHASIKQTMLCCSALQCRAYVFGHGTTACCMSCAAWQGLQPVMQHQHWDNLLWEDGLLSCCQCQGRKAAQPGQGLDLYLLHSAFVCCTSTACCTHHHARLLRASLVRVRCVPLCVALVIIPALCIAFGTLCCIHSSQCIAFQATVCPLHKLHEYVASNGTCPACWCRRREAASSAADLPAASFKLCHNADQGADQDAHRNCIPQVSHPGISYRVTTDNTLTGVRTLVLLARLLTVVYPLLFECVRCASLAVGNELHLAALTAIRYRVLL